MRVSRYFPKTVSYLGGWKGWFDVKDYKPNIYICCGFNLFIIHHLCHTDLLVYAHGRTNIPMMHYIFVSSIITAALAHQVF